MPVPSRSPSALLEEGRHARDRGDPVSANPYPEDSEEHAAWRQGWEMPDAEAGAAGAEAPPGSR